jgi:hypothetical protein
MFDHYTKADKDLPDVLGDLVLDAMSTAYDNASFK